MLWLILCIITAIIWSFSSFIDNYQTDVIFKNKPPMAMKIFDSISYFIFAVIVFFVFGVEAIAPEHIALILAAGALSALSSIPYYMALRDEEPTTAAIFYQFIPVFYLIFDWVVFHQSISSIQFIGFVTILIAPVIIVFSRKRRSSRHLEFSAAFFLLLYTVIATASGLITTHIGADYSFPSVFFFFLIGRGCCDFLLHLTHPEWHRTLVKVLHHRKKRRALILSLPLNQVMTVIAELLSRYALVIGTAALVSVAYNILELIFTFFLGIVLTLIWPKFGREKLSRHIIIAHLIAIILAIIGIILIQ